MFSTEQREKLLKFLPNSGPPSDRFLSTIEEKLTFFRANSEHDTAAPIPTPACRKSYFEKTRRTATTLHLTLTNADPDWEYYKIIESLGYILGRQEQPKDEGEAPDSALTDEEMFQRSLYRELRLESLAEEMIERLTKDLELLAEAVAFTLKYHRPGLKGRPQANRERRLMEEIAASYRECFGRLPAANTRGKFHEFIITAMGFIGFHQNSWYRSIEPAIRSLKQTRNPDLTR